MTKCKSVSNDKKYGNLERILTSFQCESYPIQVMFQHLFNSFMSLSKVLQYFSEIFFIFLLNLFLCRSFSLQKFSLEDVQNLYLEIYKMLLRKKLKTTKTHGKIIFMHWKTQWYKDFNYS